MKTLLAGMIVLLAILAGCTAGTRQDKENMMEGEWSPEEIAAMEAQHETTMASVGYQDWDKKKFDEATSEGKIVLIDFAANWCPACQAEHPELIKGFEMLNNPDIVGFRVHYKDDQTTQEMQALAEQYQIPYQHTKVVIKDGRVVLKSPEAWTADRLVQELSALA
jgi:thiol-disulfide isomerase/thioredoxin